MRCELMTQSDDLVDAAEYLRSLGAEAERFELEAIEVHATTSSDRLLIQPDRCWRLELILNELVANAAARLAGKEGRIEIELSHEADLLHCSVSGGGSEPARAVSGLELAHLLASGLRGRIGHWFDDETTSMVLTIPLTEREREANQPASTVGARGSQPVYAPLISVIASAAEKTGRPS